MSGYRFVESARVLVVLAAVPFSLVRILEDIKGRIGQKH